MFRKGSSKLRFSFFLLRELNNSVEPQERVPQNTSHVNFFISLHLLKCLNPEGYFGCYFGFRLEPKEKGSRQKLSKKP